MTGSIEYAVTHLKPPLLVVLGHTDCGALKARLAGAQGGEMGRLLSKMELQSTELDEAIRENINRQLAVVSGLECVKAALRMQAIEICGMLLDLETGRVELVNSGAPSPQG